MQKSLIGKRFLIKHMMNKQQYYYKNIFLYASLQFCGNIEKYFQENTETLLVFHVLPRQGNAFNLARRYEKGILVKEEKVTSSSNIILYYFLWYYHYLSLLLKHFSKEKKIHVISFHPLSFFFSRIQKMLRNITFVYWVGDYFPGNNPINIFYRNVSKFYHKKIRYKGYLSDRLNEKMNGKIVNTLEVKTIMWGVIPLPKKPVKKINNNLQLGFVGVMRNSQGIEFLIEAVGKISNVSLRLLGPCAAELYEKYATIIKKYHIEKRVYFPNKILYGDALQKEIEKCHIGVALYDVSSETTTFYADPAKVKTYAQYGLPILMTDAADIANYIKRFHAGEIVTQEIGSVQEAVEKITNNYEAYLYGVKAFTDYFNYEKYYKKRFAFLEIEN